MNKMIGVQAYAWSQACSRSVHWLFGLLSTGSVAILFMLFSGVRL